MFVKSHANDIGLEYDDQARALVRIVLSSEGFAVVEARDGNEGIEVAVGDNPDLIITDARFVSMRTCT